MKISAIAAASAIALAGGFAVAEDAGEAGNDALVTERPVLMTDAEMDKTVAGYNLDQAITVGGGAQPQGQTPFGAICVNANAAGGFNGNPFEGPITSQGASLAEPYC